MPAAARRWLAALLLWLLRAQLWLVTVTTSHHQQPPVTPPPAHSPTAPTSRPRHPPPRPLAPPLLHLTCVPGCGCWCWCWLVLTGRLAGAVLVTPGPGLATVSLLTDPPSRGRRPRPPAPPPAVAAHRRQGRCSEAAATPAQPPAHTFYIISGTQYVM